jgi:hypothetical protein
VQVQVDHQVIVGVVFIETKKENENENENNKKPPKKLHSIKFLHSYFIDKIEIVDS